MKKIIILDYGTGNILSLIRSLNYIGIKPSVSNSKSEILKASHLILPGVGAFSTGMKLLNHHKLPNIIKEYVAENKPLLGICLGMQLLFQESNEFGKHIGLGLIKGKVKKISYPKINVPIIGWYKLETIGKNIVSKQYNKYMYFVHSYQALPKNKDTIAATYKINNKNIVAAVNENNIYGFQFHPEKSSFDGLKILKNFINL
jgi:imidazole glycerol-phosphate synthase subunit HisH